MIKINPTALFAWPATPSEQNPQKIKTESLQFWAHPSWKIQFERTSKDLSKDPLPLRFLSAYCLFTQPLHNIKKVADILSVHCYLKQQFSTNIRGKSQPSQSTIAELKDFEFTPLAFALWGSFDLQYLNLLFIA